VTDGEEGEYIMAVGTNGALDWLYQRQRFGIRPGLERTKRTLAALGHPERSLRFIHVAGTNGKGSVCAITAAVLSERFRVGLFVSPGFDGLRGRFFVSGQEMDPDTFVKLAERVRIVSEQATPDDPLTEFEVLTVMAICYFQETAVDIVVWEAGLGGTFDSTNVVCPEITVVTNVSLDHQEILGDTVRKIAADKAGIIKRGIPIVTAATDEALDVIRETARKTEAPLYSFGIQYDTSSLFNNGSRQRIAYRGIQGDYIFTLPLLGRHQAVNAGIALAVLELLMLKRPQFQLSWSEIQAGISQTRWPGRCEVFDNGKQKIILDGAHNPAGAAALARTLRDLANPSLPTAQWTFIVGVLADKDVVQILKELVPIAKHIIVTQPQNERALQAHDLERRVRRLFNGRITTTPSVPQACEMALTQTDPVCCCGSLYTVFEARKTITEQFCHGQN
jgi:dihydrofolate synthase / folylpolyglutamate synthase